MIFFSKKKTEQNKVKYTAAYTFIWCMEKQCWESCLLNPNQSNKGKYLSINQLDFKMILSNWYIATVLLAELQ